VRGKGTKLFEHCSKVRLSQDRMPVEPLTQQQSWVRGKGLFPLPKLSYGSGERPFSPPLAKLGEGIKAFPPSPSFAAG